MIGKFILALVVVSASPAGMNRDAAPPAGEHLPYEIVQSWHFSGDGRLGGEPEVADLLLRMYVLSQITNGVRFYDGNPSVSADWDSPIARDRKIMTDTGWDPDFVATFDGIVAWGRSLLEKDPDSLYRLGTQYRAASIGSSLEANFREDVGLFLLELGAAGGHHQAWLDVARAKLDTGKEAYASVGRSTLWALANHRNYLPAQIELGDRYREGRGFERDPVKALYWYYRARANGAPSADGIAIAEQGVSIVDMARARWWLFSDQVPEE